MKTFLLIAGTAFFFSTAKCQTVNACQAVNYFLGSDSVRNLLLFDNNKISWLREPAGELAKSNCNCVSAANAHFKWVSDTSNIKKLVKNCAYYYINCTKKDNGWFVEVSQACSGLVCQGFVNNNNKEKMTASSFVIFVR